MIKLFQTKNISYYISCYFAVTAIIGCLRMLGFDWIWYLYAIFNLCIVIFVYRYMQTEANTFDKFFLFGIILIIAPSLFIDYDPDLSYNAIKGVFLSMPLFFAGRSKFFCDFNVFNRMIIPWSFAALAGVILYFTSPSWYMDMKLAETEGEVSSNHLLEMSRLSSFWKYQYWISYGSGLLYLYILFVSFKNKKFTRLALSLSLCCWFIMFLAQQRAPMFFSIFAMFGYFVLDNVKNGFKSSFRNGVIVTVLLIFAIGAYLITIIDTDMLMRFIEKVTQTSETSEFISYRTDIFSDVARRPVSIFGDGLGYFTLTENNNNVVITDHQYLKILHECGYFGSFIYFLLIVIPIIKGLKNFNDNMLELSVVAFYLFALNGANCLQVNEQHPLIFWFCLGRLTNMHALNYKRNNDYSIDFLNFRRIAI